MKGEINTYHKHMWADVRVHTHTHTPLTLEPKVFWNDSKNRDKEKEGFPAGWWEGERDHIAILR